MGYQCLILKSCFVCSFLMVKCKFGLNGPQVKVMGRTGKNLRLLKWNCKYFGTDESRLLQWPWMTFQHMRGGDPIPLLIKSIVDGPHSQRVTLVQTPGICIQIRYAFPKVNFYHWSWGCYFTEERISANIRSI